MAKTGANTEPNTWKAWWREALSKADNVSTTRIILLAVTVYVLVLPILALILGRFTVELAWFLLGIFTSACGLKGGQKIYEVRRELGQSNYHRPGGVTSGGIGGNSVAKGRD